MKYNFNDLCNDLRIGREIEFKYNNNECGIVNFDSKWYFVVNNKSTEICFFDEKTKLIDYLCLVSLENIPLSDIFNQNLYDIESLYIL